MQATLFEFCNRYWVILGAFLMVCAAFFRTWGTAYLQANVMRDSRVHTEKLLADGPYRRVRNPLATAGKG
jgi:protein-S-isoprenylcysteine O-methyltransferase Ste14